MKVYVVTRETFTNETFVVKVFTDEPKAEDFVEEMNARYNSSYGDVYDYEEYEVE